jgi:hypothetical protein
MIGKVRLLIFLFVLLPVFLVAQDTINDEQEQQMEMLSNSFGEDQIDFTNLTDALRHYKKKPLNLNKAGRDELMSLLLLNEIQVFNLLEHIRRTGPLISIQELQTIEGFDLQTIRNIVPFVMVSPDPGFSKLNLKTIFREGRYEYFVRWGQVLEQQKGYSPIDSAGICKSPNSRYAGSPYRLFTRFRFTYGTRISFGIGAEKDPGEVFLPGDFKFDYPCYTGRGGKPAPGFDFYSAHLFIREIGPVKALALGDYQVSFGQGLISWTGLAFGKAYDGVSIKRNGFGIRPHTSPEENRFLRGGASTIRLPLGFELTGFYSHKKIDANITLFDTLIPGEAVAFSSFQTSGYHSTLSELEDRKSLSETVYGGNLTWRKKRFSIAGNFLKTEYSAQLDKTIQLYNQFDFRGRSLMNGSLNYNWVFRNMNIFGETALSENGGMATVNGIMIAMDPRVSFSVLHRHYEKNYQSIMSNGFGEGTNTNNESGIYVGMQTRFNSKWTAAGFYDQFRFPWLKYGISAPSSGYEAMGQLNYTPSRKNDFYLRVRKRVKATDGQATQGIDPLINGENSSVRIHGSVQALPGLSLRTRVEFTFFKEGTDREEQGFLIYQDFIVKRPGSRLSFTGRVSLFDTEGYNSRIYVYENDLPFTWSIPALYEKGARYYAMVNYDITRNFEVYARISQTYYTDLQVISAGQLTEITGNKKTEVRAMIRLKF